MEAPLLESEIWDVYQVEGVIVLGLGRSYMTMQDAIDWQHDYNLTYPVWVDVDNDVNDMYSDGYIPYNTIINQNMVVIQTGSDSTINQLKRKLDAVLNIPPLPPAGLTVDQAGTDSVDLSWQENVEKDVVGYELTYIEESTRLETIIDVGPETSWTISGLASGTNYSFTVKAYDFRGNFSPASDPVYAMTEQSVPSLSAVSTILLLMVLSLVLVRPRVILKAQTSRHSSS